MARRAAAKELAEAERKANVKKVPSKSGPKAKSVASSDSSDNDSDSSDSGSDGTDSESEGSTLA